MKGQIISENPDPEAIDNHAIVINDRVVNVISADVAFIQANTELFDFAVNLSVSELSAQIGDSYDSGNNSFQTPVVDWSATLQADLNNIHGQLMKCLSDYAEASQQQKTIGMQMGTADVSQNFTSNENALWNQIVSYIAGGG